MLLLARRPRLGYAFKVLGCALILISALWFKSYLILIFALPLTWSVFKQWGTLGMLQTVPIPASDIVNDRTRCIEYVAEKVAERNSILNNEPAKIMLFANALLQYVKATKLSSKEIVAGLASYCLFLGFGVYITFSVFDNSGDDYYSDYETKEYWLESLESSPKDEHWPLLASAANEMMRGKRFEDADFFVSKMQTHALDYQQPNWHLAQFRILQVKLRDLKANENIDSYDYDNLPLSDEDYIYVRDNILGDTTGDPVYVMTQFYTLMRRTPEVPLKIKSEWISHFEKNVSQLQPEQAAYLYLEKGKIAYDQNQTGPAITAFMIGFSYEQKNEYGFYSHGYFTQLVNVFVEQQNYAELFNIAEQRLARVDELYQDRLKDYDSKASDSYFFESYVREQRKLLQIQSWAMFWNNNIDGAVELNQRALMVDNRRRAEVQDATWDNSAVALHVEKELFSGFVTLNKSLLAQRDPFDGIHSNQIKKFKKSCDCKKRGAYDAARYGFYSAYVEQAAPIE